MDVIDRRLEGGKNFAHLFVASIYIEFLIETGGNDTQQFRHEMNDTTVENAIETPLNR
jgi:hypothetical protein